jgi:hypothetical protein
MKLCPKCKKPGEFNRDRSREDGLSFYCKSCIRKQKACYYKSDKVSILAKNREWRESNVPFMLWSSAKRRANKRGTPFTITVEDVRAAWPSDGLCPVLGTAFKMGRGGGPEPLSPSLDAFVPILGYVPGNIRVISFRANHLKSDVTDPSELEAVARWMRSIH